MNDKSEYKSRLDEIIDDLYENGSQEAVAQAEMLKLQRDLNCCIRLLIDVLKKR